MDSTVIRTFDASYLDQMAQLFVEEYSEPPTRRWDVATAKRYLQRNLDSFPEYCLMVVDTDGTCIGAIFCRVDPYYKGDILFADSLQIQKEWRNKGVAKRLLQEVFRRAKENGLLGVHLLADAREGFPRNWYEKIGFELSGWAEYEAEWEKLEKFLEE